MRGPTWRPWRAAAVVAALTLCASLVLAAGPEPTGRPPAVASSSDVAAGCRDLRGGAMVACLHGNDTPPPGVSLFDRPTLAELEARTSLASANPRLRGLAQLEQATGVSATASPAVPCIGNGTSGKRIQAIYARALDQPDHYADLLASLRQWAAEADQAVWASAGPTGGGRHLRFVTDSSCQLDVDHVVLTPLGDDSFGQMRAELQLKGYTRSDRKYLVWVDAAAGICGLGEVYFDQRPGAENYNNSGPMYARVDAPCWQYAELHEIFHTLGAVQPDVPHPSANLHCTDEADVMCYDDDDDGPVAMTTICPPEHEALLDCGDDDYFSTDPPGGSYLASSWNTADSGFLQSDVAPRPSQLTLSGAASITYGGRASLAGRLSDERTGDGVAGEPVNLFARRAGASSDQAAGSVTSAADGKVGWTRSPTATTAYRASYPGSGTYGTANSARVTIGVRTRVTARRSASTVRAGQTLTVTGAVGPNHRGQRVYLQRLAGGRWRTVATTTLTSASGYRLRVRPSVRGRLSYRVLKSADRDHLSGTSQRLPVTVR
jgi:hypothetical protein